MLSEYSSFEEKKLPEDLDTQESSKIGDNFVQISNVNLE
jgi:hypothetical protein